MYITPSQCRINFRCIKGVRKGVREGVHTATKLINWINILNIRAVPSGSGRFWAGSRTCPAVPGVCTSGSGRFRNGSKWFRKVLPNSRSVWCS